MQRNTTLVLGGIAAIMLGYIIFVDEGSLSTGELEGRTGHVVERFVRARVQRLELTHGAGDAEVHLVMVRDQSEEEDMETFDVGTWAIEEPVEGPVDVDAVDALLSAVEWLDARRELSGITAEDRTRFGLDAPRATLVFAVANESHTITVGGDDPRGEGVYAMVDDPTRAYIVGNDFLEALTHDVEHFRSKELFPDFRTADVRTANLAAGDAEARLERVDSRWWLRAPTDMMARGSLVDEMLRSVGDLRAERFLGESPAALEGLGLDAPVRSIALTFAPWAEGSTHEGEERPELTLRIGAACPGHPGEVVARVSEGPVVCVAAPALERLEQSFDRYRELRILSTADDAIERIEVARGDVGFELRRQDGEWELVRGESTGPADGSAIEEWLGELRRVEAASFEPATEESLAARELGDGETGLTLTLHRTDDGGTETVRLGATDDDGVWVRRGDEGQVAQYALTVVDLLAAPAIRFRARTLVPRSREDLASFTVIRAEDPGHDETVHKEGAVWTLETPFEGRADGAAVGDVVDALAPLSALRFVADGPSREHGLESPRFIVRASFDAASDDEEDEEAEDDGHDHGSPEDEEDEEDDEDASAVLDITLKIGADTEGGAFAQFGDDPAVFVVADALVAAIDEPLVSRDALSVPASEIESITLRRGAESHVLQRTEAGWTYDGAPAPNEPTLAMLDRLAELRAVGAIRYDVTPLRAPALVLEIARREGAPVLISIGAATGEGDAAWHPVRTEPGTVTYRFSGASLAAIVGFGQMP